MSRPCRVPTTRSPSRPHLPPTPSRRARRTSAPPDQRCGAHPAARRCRCRRTERGARRRHRRPAASSRPAGSPRRERQPCRARGRGSRPTGDRADSRRAWPSQETTPSPGGGRELTIRSRRRRAGPARSSRARSPRAQSCSTPRPAGDRQRRRRGTGGRQGC